MRSHSQTWRIGVAVVIILGAILYLAVTGARSDRSYYVTIAELQAMGAKAYTRHLRVAGNVVAGSIEHSGANARFVLVEEGRTLPVSYQGIEPPPDTFKDNAQALAVGTYGRDGIFHATQLQAKCASKYAPQNKSATPALAGAAEIKPSTPSGRGR